MKDIHPRAALVRLMVAAALLASFAAKMKTAGFHGGF